MRPSFTLPAVAMTAALLAVPAGAALCAADPVPAATVLVPYFAVDLAAAEGEGLNTHVQITNTRAETTLVNLTLWTDWGTPVIAYNLYLTGYDVEAIDLYDHLKNGNFTITGPETNDHGPYSEAADFPPACINFFPFFINPLLTGNRLIEVQNSLMGQARDDDTCAGSDQGDQIARGYVTIDVVQQCGLSSPTEEFYYDDILAFDNVLLGEMLLVDPSQGLAQRFSGVHIEAAPEGFFDAGDHTFYGRYVGADARDRREPLPSRFGVRFLGDPSPGSQAIVWRETAPQSLAGVPCKEAPPTGIPIATTDPLIFDDQENPATGPLGADLATQHLTLGDHFPAVPDAGWSAIDLRHDALQGIYGDDLTQGWVLLLRPPPGGIAIANPPLPGGPTFGQPAAQLDNLCTEAGR